MSFRVLYQKHQSLSNFLILLIPTIIYLGICIYQVIQANNKSYIIEKEDLYVLDSIQMLDRGQKFKGKGGSSIHFRDEKWKNFIISGSPLGVLRDEAELLDTMQYSTLVMTVITDKMGFENYFNLNNDDRISVLGIKVGDKSYISLDDINKVSKENIVPMIIYSSIIYFIFLWIHFYRILNPEKIKRLEERRALRI